jgi:hypothetical protein
VNAVPESEWPETLDVRGLMADGWRPVPLREFVLKIHSRCDLACDYCYMYTMADQSWRSQPRQMSRLVLEQSAARIAEHVRAHGLPSVKVILSSSSRMSGGWCVPTWHVLPDHDQAPGSRGDVRRVAEGNGGPEAVRHLAALLAMRGRAGPPHQRRQALQLMEVVS